MTPILEPTIRERILTLRRQAQEARLAACRALAEGDKAATSAARGRRF
jgi:hypothetical protein